MVAHQPIRKTIKAMSMITLSMPTTAPAVREVNQSFEASVSMFVTSSTLACSIVDSIKLGSEVPEWATSACACKEVYKVSLVYMSS